MVSPHDKTLFSFVQLAVDSGGIDFISVNHSAYSCIEEEYGANTSVSQISLRIVGGSSFELTRFGGVIVTRADNY